MIKIEDIKVALELFQEAATKHAAAIEKGDYKTANKSYAIVVSVVAFLKAEDALDNLLELLNSPVLGIRLAAATYILPVHEAQGMKALEAITKISGIHSLTAETTISEWKKGNLKL